MLRNYLAAALRNLVRNRLYAAINIIGLAVGFAAALLIALFVRDELTFDRYFTGYDRIYLLALENRFFPESPALLHDYAPEEFAQELKLDFPFLKDVARLLPPAPPGIGGVPNPTLRVGSIESVEPVMWADSNIFDILSFKAIVGNLNGALANPDSIVLTQALARKYFGSNYPVGRTIELKLGQGRPVEDAVGTKDWNTFIVTAVIEDLPTNVHLSGGAIVASHAAISPLTQVKPLQDSSSMLGALTYLKLPDTSSVGLVEPQLPAFLKRHKQVPPELRWALHLRPLAGLHFSPSDGLGYPKPRGNLNALLAISAIGVLIVLAAAINFVNLMTARASRRAVEVGVRKVAGAVRSDLVVQFIGESVIYVAIGAGLGLAAAALLLPSLNTYMDRVMHFAMLTDPTTSAFVAALLLLVGVLAGLYPAFVLSAFSPAAVLKAGMSQRGTPVMVRQGLVVVQFALLIGLLIATAIIYRQINFAVTEALRLNSDEVVIVEKSCRPSFKEAVAALSGVRGVTCSDSIVIAGVGAKEGWSTFVEMPGGERGLVKQVLIEPTFFEFYGLTPMAGSFFDDHMPHAANAVVINEAAAKMLGYKSPLAAVGQTLNGKGQGVTQEIIGVAPDFITFDIRQAYHPGMFKIATPEKHDGMLTSIRLAGAKTPETLAEIDRIWSEIEPGQLINRYFLRQSVEARYREIAREGQLFAIFSGVAIVIGLLGLFGMAAFTAEQRTKEIGIRKAMGATRRDIVGLMLWQFAKPMLWANLIAWPVTGYFMRRWLETFAQHVSLEPWLFLGVSAVAIMIALATVISHALMVARAQPVAALRYE